MAPSDYTLIAPPRISRAAFQRVLTLAASPAASAAHACYDVCLRSGVDPAIALAFFHKESSYGKAGAARATLNWGNLRASQGRAYKVDLVPGSKGSFAYYHSWQVSIADFCDLLNTYDKRGAGRQKGTRLQTVRAALVEYAPSDDGNDPNGYAATVIRLVSQWSDMAPPAPPVDHWALWGDAYPLPLEQRTYAIPALWREHAEKLGKAASSELYADGIVAFRIFERGVIVYDLRRDTAGIV